MSKQIALNINFDSLADCLKLVGAPTTSNNEKDPCFFSVMNRFLSIASEYNAKFTLFMVGRDLENPHHAEAVSRWHAMGHEIANHSYSHRHDLSRLSPEVIKSEIEETDHILSGLTNGKINGFTAPGWHSSELITQALKELGYRYDASLGPTWIFTVAQTVLWLKSPGARKMVSFLRPDFVGNLTGKRTPYYPSAKNYLQPRRPTEVQTDHIMIPLPTIPGIRLGVWHTLAFSLPDWMYFSLLKSALQTNDYFYYLMHPTDLIDPAKDLDGFSTKLTGIHRMTVPLAEKELKMRRAFEILAKSGNFVTMSELCTQWENSTKLNSSILSPVKS